jgi:hypothetical protein
VLERIFQNEQDSKGRKEGNSWMWKVFRRISLPNVLIIIAFFICNLKPNLLFFRYIPTIKFR